MYGHIHKGREIEVLTLRVEVKGTSNKHSNKRVKNAKNYVPKPDFLNELYIDGSK